MEDILTSREVANKLNIARDFMNTDSPEAGDWICTESILLQCLASVYLQKENAMKKIRQEEADAAIMKDVQVRNKLTDFMKEINDVQS